MKKTASKIAIEVLTKVATDLRRKSELPEDFIKDLADMIVLERRGAYSQLPKTERFKEIERGTPAQRWSGFSSGVTSGVLGGLTPAALMYFLGQKKLAPWGVLLGVPSSIMGYMSGVQKQRQQELRQELESWVHK